MDNLKQLIESLDNLVEEESLLQQYIDNAWHAEKGGLIFLLGARVSVQEAVEYYMDNVAKYIKDDNTKDQWDKMSYQEKYDLCAAPVIQDLR